MKYLSAALLCFALAVPAQAQQAGEVARAAALELDRAARDLLNAETAQDRVNALSAALRAHEASRADLREARRQAAVRQSSLERRLESQEHEIAQLLGVLSLLEANTQPAAIAHPDGPLALARAGMLVSSVTPALVTEAEALRADLNEITRLQDLLNATEAQLRDGKIGAQRARAALSQAIADRDPTLAFDEDPVLVALLQATAATLEDFAQKSHRIATQDVLPPAASAEDLRDTLPWPALGRILRHPGEADAAGVTRPGLILGTDPGALVTAPVAATLLYAGPMSEDGLVAILEPAPDLLLVLTGFDKLLARTGQVLAGGEALALMGGQDFELSNQGEGAGAGRGEALYIEVRHKARAVDPLRWFTSEKG